MSEPYYSQRTQCFFRFCERFFHYQCEYVNTVTNWSRDGDVVGSRASRATTSYSGKQGGRTLANVGLLWKIRNSLSVNFPIYINIYTNDRRYVACTT